MLIPFTDLLETYNLSVNGILHLGTSTAKEAPEYAEYTDNVIWIEANPHVALRLERVVGKFGQRVIQALLGERDGETMRFHVTDTFKRSSVAVRSKLIAHDIMLKSMRLDTLVWEQGWSDLNFLMLGVPGSEITVLRGAQRYISHVDYVYVADFINASQVDNLLDDFMRLETITADSRSDAFWIRRERNS